MMKKFRFYPLLLAFVLLIVGCEKEYIDPIDIFETEELTDPEELDLGGVSGTDTLYVNADRVRKTDNGYHIKGSLFSKSLSGKIPITNGEFFITTNESIEKLKLGVSGLSFNGYGTADFPDAGLLEDAEIQDIPGSDVYYNTGKVFKEESKISVLPLLDDRYYFRYKIDNPKKGKEYRLKKMIFKMREYYMDAYDPSVLFVGDVYHEKAGVRRKVIEQMGVGLSANELFEFIPYTYSERLEEVVEGTGFESFNGGVYLSGIIPLRKYPMKIRGTAILNTSYSGQGNLDFFERGFDEASLQMGVNGQLYFDHQLIKILPMLDTVEIGHATLQVELSESTQSLRMAGEYTTDYLKKFVGEEALKWIPYNAGSGMMYVRITDNLDDFIVYMEENISFNVPGLGTTPLAQSTFKITKDDIEVSGTMNLPYGIGDMEVIGKLGRDGTFLLSGEADCNIDLGGGMVYESHMYVEISNEGVILKGSMDLPYGIGSVDVTGVIKTDGTLLLSGEADCNINLGEGMEYSSHIFFEISNSGIVFEGSMDFPYEIGAVSVKGGITAEEIFFEGSIEAAIGFPPDVSLNAELSLKASSVTGITLQGGMTLPAGIGYVNVYGELNGQGLLLQGDIGTGINISVGDIHFKTSGSMSLTASTNPNVGVRFTGSVSLPFGLGNASVTATFAPGNEISFTGDLGSKISIAGVSVFNVDMSLSASTKDGLYIYGYIELPGKLGSQFVSGSVNSSGFTLRGSNTYSIDFEIVELSTSFSFRISNANVKISAEGEGCIDLLVGELCESVGVDINPDFSDGSLELCIDFPVVGDACIGW